eukprot:CAMPEP_0196751800 /NCGR_PEP_ID=MMETSP1091-20130531/85016_1 /TAXON_ID=302021 /ORGANISM="Rhodomonas sp., Strain CCMP768" /LENGTH=161 /DNA_ID=CAMNT_0042099645 /DNA_START=13 /DNA_END=498 /DNA_ORIENTATION=-
MTVATMVTLTRLTGLCIAFAAFSFAAEKVRQPFLKMAKRKTVLDDLIAALEAWVDCTVGKQDPTNSQTEQREAPNAAPSLQCGGVENLQVTEIEPGDLCSRCTESRSTIMELERMSMSMGIAYPGEAFAPCQSCLERMSSLLRLERRFSSRSAQHDSDFGS